MALNFVEENHSDLLIVVVGTDEQAGAALLLQVLGVVVVQLCKIQFDEILLQQCLPQHGTS